MLAGVASTGYKAMPPFLMRFEKDLVKDGITAAIDVRWIGDELFELWEQPYFRDDPKVPGTSIFDPELGDRPRYPNVGPAQEPSSRHVPSRCVCVFWGVGGS